MEGNSSTFMHKRQHISINAELCCSFNSPHYVAEVSTLRQWWECIKTHPAVQTVTSLSNIITSCFLHLRQTVWRTSHLCKGINQGRNRTTLLNRQRWTKIVFKIFWIGKYKWSCVFYFNFMDFYSLDIVPFPWMEVIFKLLPCWISVRLRSDTKGCSKTLVLNGSWVLVPWSPALRFVLPSKLTETRHCSDTHVLVWIRYWSLRTSSLRVNFLEFQR